MKIALIKKNNQLYPYYNSDVIAWDKLRNNVVYFAEFKKPRHLEHHKKFFALANCTIANLPDNHFLKHLDAYGLIKAIEREIGLIEYEYKIDGTCEPKAKSINFESMDQLEFQPFYDKAVYIMAGLLKCTIEQLETNSIDYL